MQRQRDRFARGGDPLHRQPQDARRVRPRAGRASAPWSARVNRLRGYGDFLHYHLLARGALDVVIESDVNILDIAALAVIVREAGGTFTDLAGRDITLQTTSVLAANPLLHAPVLESLGAARAP